MDIQPYPKRRGDPPTRRGSPRIDLGSIKDPQADTRDTMKNEGPKRGPGRPSGAGDNYRSRVSKAAKYSVAPRNY